MLSGGDTISLTLCDDRSVSITHNDTQVFNVFGRLPHGPLWLVWVMNIGEMKVIQQLPKPEPLSASPSSEVGKLHSRLQRKF